MPRSPATAFIPPAPPPRRPTSLNWCRESDRSLDRLMRQLIAARVRAGFTQEQLAWRLRTKKSAISRLEAGKRHRPTLSTIENCALVLGYRVEVRLLPMP